MNIIFLDIDGVLNSITNTKMVIKNPNEGKSGSDYPFCSKSLNNLKLLVDLTNSKTVIISIWRKNEKGRKRIIEEFKKYDLNKSFLCFLPYECTRDIEILNWLKRHDDINYIIIDDDMEKFYNKSRVVKTSILDGFTDLKRDESIQKLLKKNSSTHY